MSDLFDRARAARRLEGLAADLVSLRGYGNERRGPCPICEAGATSKSAPFKVDVDRQTWRCFSCERHGDVVDLHAEMTGKSLAAAARDLAGHELPKAEPRAPRDKPLTNDNRAQRIARMASDMWSSSRPIAGTLAARYLLGRAIDPAIVDQLDGPRFADSAPHSWNPDARVWRRAPAMICRVVTPGGWPGGVHVTYLDPAGGKAALEPAKRMWGPQGDRTPTGTRRGGAWLIGSFPDDGDLVIGEGIESSLSLASFLWRRGRRGFGVVATLSLGGLQGIARRDASGCLDLARPEPDPASAAFTWRPCYTAGRQRPSALIGVDLDMSPVRIKIRTGRGRVVEAVQLSEDRARLCAHLASRAWIAAGWNAQVFYPSPGGDWNDRVRR